MISVKGLSKDYGNFRAVDQISFDVPQGQILGFLGPNGAGKSTTMKMLTCFIQPTEGTATVGGEDIKTNPLAVRRQIGYLPESAPSYGEMSVREFLEFVAELRGMRGKNRINAAEKMREICALAEVWEQAIETLSKGYKQRVGFAQALIHDPPVLVLDEPTDGLDPNQKHEVRRLIKEMGKDKTIILSTHILEEVEAVCERVVIIAEGKMVADATPQDLLAQSSLHNAVTMSLPQAELEKAREYLSKLGEIERVEVLKDLPDSIRVFPRAGKPIISEVAKAVQKQHWDLSDIHVEQGRLDEVFRKVTIPSGGSN